MRGAFTTNNLNARHGMSFCECVQCKWYCNGCTAVLSKYNCNERSIRDQGSNRARSLLIFKAAIRTHPLAFIVSVAVETRNWIDWQRVTRMSVLFVFFYEIRFTHGYRIFILLQEYFTYCRMGFIIDILVYNVKDINWTIKINNTINWQ